MKVSDFDLFRDLLKKESGLMITQDKTYLLDSRLTPVAKKWDLHTLDELAFKLRSNIPDPKLVKDIVDAMTTNETSFFRDRRPFDLFETVVLPYMLEHRKTSHKIRIWCPACSSGQEPYTLAMQLRENSTKLSGWTVEILATDLSSGIIEQAKNGTYTQFEVQRGLPITHLVKYFTQENEKWVIKGDIKQMVHFEEFNLLDDMNRYGKFDVIFCRNVLIYFDQETKTDVLNRLKRQMVQDGFLFLGGAETVLGVTDAFKTMEGQRGLYLPTDAPDALNEYAAKLA